MLRAVVDYDLAESALRTEVARQYPEVRIGPGYTYDHGVQKIPFNLTLVLPPLDLNRAAIAQAEARRTEAGARWRPCRPRCWRRRTRRPPAWRRRGTPNNWLATGTSPSPARRRRGARRWCGPARAIGSTTWPPRPPCWTPNWHCWTPGGRTTRRSSIWRTPCGPFDPAEHALLQDSFRRLGVAR
uniref:Uncharacterized protein n=1 Tax=Phenylobacterium glaciei TaxID=2803784 RepID=A0A974S776_9CAUL|nr:hypothetical protein JKL49_20890 [Phenylobacterium glaciei]